MEYLIVALLVPVNVCVAVLSYQHIIRPWIGRRWPRPFCLDDYLLR